MPATILIVDDEEDIVQLLKYNLEKEGYNVLTAHNGADAIKIAEQSPLDLIILDVMMPEMDGYAVCRKLRTTQLHASTPIIFLTARVGELDEILGLELGADDYIQKPISPRVLLARLKSIFRRSSEMTKTETVVMPEVMRIENLEINRQNYTVKVEGSERFFPKKEFELLAFLASNPGKVFSREDLLNRIWGENVFVVDRTVDVHISKIREKLSNNGKLIETVKGVGYRFRT